MGGLCRRGPAQKWERLKNAPDQSPVLSLNGRPDGNWKTGFFEEINKMIFNIWPEIESAVLYWSAPKFGWLPKNSRVSAHGNVLCLMELNI